MRYEAAPPCCTSQAGGSWFKVPVGPCLWGIHIPTILPQSTIRHVWLTVDSKLATDVLRACDGLAALQTAGEGLSSPLRSVFVK